MRRGKEGRLHWSIAYLIWNSRRRKNWLDLFSRMLPHIVFGKKAETVVRNSDWDLVERPPEPVSSGWIWYFAGGIVLWRCPISIYESFSIRNDVIFSNPALVLDDVFVNDCISMKISPLFLHIGYNVCTLMLSENVTSLNCDSNKDFEKYLHRNLVPFTNYTRTREFWQKKLTR